MSEKNYYSVQELADLLHVSRVTVFNHIKKGLIKAEKVGRNYVISKETVSNALDQTLSDDMTHDIKQGVKKVVDEYGETLEKLGKE